MKQPIKKNKSLRKSTSANTSRVLKRLKPRYPRKYLPAKINCSNWTSLKPIIDNLAAAQPKTPSELKLLMDKFLELSNAMYDHRTRLYIEMTCATNDQVKSAAYLDFVEHIEPKWDDFLNTFNNKVLRHPLKNKLDKKLFGKWLTSLSAAIDLFTKKNLQIQPQILHVSHIYQKTCGSMVVKWNGKNQTVVQMNKALLDGDRNKREKAWRTTWQRFIQDRQPIDALFNQLLSLRGRVATNAGLKSFRDFCFKKYERTDYSVKDCLLFHEAVEKTVVPLYKEILKYRKSRLGVSTLRPWDLACDISNKPALKPFTNAHELAAGVERILKRVDPTLGSHFKTMRSKNLLDLDNRVGKAPGGYQIILDECRLPFIFMNAVGSNQDIFTLLHESGHAMHAFLCRDYALMYDREPAKEFCEVASMSMERFGMEHLEEFYSPKDANRARMLQNEEVFRLFAWVAIVDSFQHWLYANPGHTKAARNKQWIETMDRFQAGLDWTGLNDYRKTAWHRQLHIFQYPFYYIEYGIALLGSLQLGMQFENNKQTALTNYKNALSLGGTVGLRQLFETAHLKFDFSYRTMGPLVKKVFGDWQRLQSV